MPVSLVSKPIQPFYRMQIISLYAWHEFTHSKLFDHGVTQRAQLLQSLGLVDFTIDKENETNGGYDRIVEYGLSLIHFIYYFGS